MKVIINQWFALGDILFIEPIYKHFHDRGFEVVAPVNPEYLWIQEYIPYVKFENKEKFPYSYETVDQPEDGNRHVPLRFAHPLLRGYALHYGDDRKNWMGDKYLYLGLPVELWKTLSFKRNREREYQLYNHFQETYPIKGGQYNLVNNYFGGSHEKIDIKIPNRLPTIFMQKTGNFSLIDWGKVIENAENIYTVETSLVYLIESLKCKAKEFHLYPRMPFLPNTDYMKDLLGEKWIYHSENDL